MKLRKVMDDLSHELSCPGCGVTLGYFEGVLTGFEANCPECGEELYPANVDARPEDDSP